MHLLEQNVNKQTVDLEAAKAEKEIYKAKSKTFISLWNILLYETFWGIIKQPADMII